MIKLQHYVYLVLSLGFINYTAGLEKGYVPAYDPLCNIGYAQERYMAVTWDCTGWIDCIPKVDGGFAAVWTRCPPTLSFSALSRNCVAKTLCPDQKTTSVAFCQSGMSSNMAFKHPDSCAMFYQCNNTKPHTNLRVYENECGAGFLFDERDAICKPADQVRCGDRVIPSGTCGYRKLCKLPECKGAPNGYYALKNAPFTSEYYECITGQFVAIRKCTGAGEIFDPINKNCSIGIVPSKYFSAYDPVFIAHKCVSYGNP
ncbi:hypothetical protein SNE40_000811 [Patella caerulea]|uniref:Chitin-binding type-2 domain-containing protein n=1 Tax=Patella caerulea TaxID=87958 RepID=A0AAN8KKR5_PATCE